MRMTITEEQKSNIVTAIRDAELQTSAEIFAVLAERSDDYRYIAFCFLAFWIFLVSTVLAVWLEWQGPVMSGSDWSASAEVHGRYIYLLPVLWAQLAAFVTGIVFFRLFPRFAVLVTPRRIAHDRAHANGVKQFLAHGIHNTKGRTGVLVFVSLEEHYAEILVDAAIEDKTGRDYFIDQVSELIRLCSDGRVAEGFETTVRSIGAVLKKDFPLTDDDLNEIEDKLIVL